MLGTRWSPRSYELRDFLARNHVPYQWIDVELTANDPETKRLLEALGPEAPSLAGGAFPGWDEAAEERSRGCRAKSGPAHARADRLLRSGDCGRRAGGSGGCGLWRVRGPAYGDDRAGSAGRPGGDEFADRELSGISDGTERRRSGAARGGAGAAFWRGDTVAAGSGRRRGPRGHIASSSWPTAARFPATR